MKSVLLTILLSFSIYSQAVVLELINDSTLQKEIKEITVYGSLSKILSLPMVMVDSAALQKTAFFTPADALQRETGISLSRDGLWATSVNIRGFSEQRLLFLVDGDRIQTATDIAGALSTVDMSSLNKIEVIKGASSVLYGTGAMGGIVNFVSERPAYSQTFQTNGKIGTEFNFANSLWANGANVQFTTNQWYLGLTGSYRTAQNMQTPDGKLPNSQFNDASYGLKGGIKYGNNQEFIATYNHFEAWNVGLPGSKLFPATATVRYTGIVRNQLSGEYIFSDISDVLKEMRFKAYTQYIARDVENRLNPLIVVLPSSKNTSSGLKGTANLYFNDYNTIILGAEICNRNSKTVRLTVKDSIDGSETYSNFLAVQPTPKSDMLDLGVFGQYNWKIDPGKWEMNTGLRLDYIKLSNDTAFNPWYQKKKVSSVSSLYQSENNFLLDYSIRKVAFLPDNHIDLGYSAHIDLNFYPSKSQRLSLMLANSYRAASIEERFKYIDLGSGIHKGNSQLKPEKGLFSNLSYVFSGNNLSLKTDLFANYLFDLITEVQTSALPLIYENKNVNEAYFIGTEIELKWLINQTFSIITNASYTRGKDIDSLDFLPQIPPLHGFMSLNYISKKQFQASISAMWAARQAEVAPTETPTNGHIIFNFNFQTAKFDLNKTYLQLFAGVDNLLNTAYYNHLTSVRMGGKMYLEPGRNVYMKLKYSW